MPKHLLLALALALADPRPADAWFTLGHRLIARTAIEELASTLPTFFESGIGTVEQLAVDPDAMKHPDLPSLRRAEGPEHYIDSELLGIEELPADRVAYLELLANRGLSVEVGTLPFAALEWTERLTVALAEHRRWPESEPIRAKALVYAGLLAHYAGDLGQPLHTTIHHDGRARADGSSTATGFHFAIDPLLESVPFSRDRALAALPTLPSDPWGAVCATLAQSRARVEAAYGLEEMLAERPFRPEVVAFTEERFAASVGLLVTLYRAAWTRSAEVELAEWLVTTREAPP